MFSTMHSTAESDLATFVQIKDHFRTTQRIDTGLFTAGTRPENVRQLYDAAAKTPVEAIDEMARLSGRADAHRRGSDVFLCTPVLGQNRRRMRTNVDVEIETRMVSEFLNAIVIIIINYCKFAAVVTAIGQLIP